MDDCDGRPRITEARVHPLAQERHRLDRGEPLVPHVDELRGAPGRDEAVGVDEAVAEGHPRADGRPEAEAGDLATVAVDLLAPQRTTGSGAPGALEGWGVVGREAW